MNNFEVVRNLNMNFINRVTEVYLSLLVSKTHKKKASNKKQANK